MNSNKVITEALKTGAIYNVCGADDQMRVISFYVEWDHKATHWSVKDNSYGQEVATPIKVTPSSVLHFYDNTYQAENEPCRYFESIADAQRFMRSFINQRKMKAHAQSVAMSEWQLQIVD